MIALFFILGLSAQVFARNGQATLKPEYLNWIEKAKEGDTEKGYLSGLAFYSGTGGAAHDYEKAFKWFKVAAKGGSSAASVKLGDMYTFAYFVAANEKKAFQWYLQAAKSGNSEGMEKLGDIYANGEIFEKDSFEAARWYKNAAEKSHIPSPSLKLARLYYLGGEHFKKDEKKALKWFIHAFELGDADVAPYISGIYEDSGNNREAGQWLIKGAHKGGSLAMFYLAKAYARVGVYSNKSIVQHNLMQAYKWLSVLTKKEYQPRFDKLFKQIASKVSKAEKKEAGKLAAPLIVKLVGKKEIKYTKKARANPLKLK
ncbi:MAG: tetratricopeptide repeat protein [Elusimicrobiota bacterium]|nr:tetratricopeptide repeat protein [Elusimicrobiota bacterium]